MSSTTGAATRGAAADNRDDPRRGRLTGPAWRDVARAVRLGKKSDAYSVEVHGVRIVFKMSVPKPSQETCGGKAQERPARRRQEPTTSASAVRKDNELNSAQRRSAKRLQEYLQLKGAHGQGVVHSSGSTSEDAVELAQAEPGVRNAEAAHCEAEATGGAQERAADEASAYEHQPSPYKEQGPHTGASRQTHTQEPIAVDLATIKKRQADSGPQRPRGSITCRFCGGRHQSSHRMPKCRCEQPGWYEHMRPWSPPKRWPRGAQPQSITSPKRALENDVQEGERPTTMVRRRGAV